MSKKFKNSLIAGGLITTAGLFIAKLIGLAYTIPFSYILESEAYMGMYGGAYRIYSYLLQVFTAGFPFAIATVTAKYATGNSWGKVKAVQRISTKILTVLGLIGMILMWLLAPILAPHMTTPEHVPAMMVVLIILGLALFIVPVISSYRGYLEGLKKFDVYSKSQVLEQVYRVGFLLGMAFLIVYVFEMDRLWALYASVASTSVAGIATFIYLRKFVIDINKTLPVQNKWNKELTREIIALAIPYMIVAVLGYLDDIISTTIVPDCLMRFGQYTNAQVETITSAMNYAGTKLMAIPLILAPGFTASLIPHITECLTQNNYKAVRNNITQTIITVVLIVMPVCAFIIFFAKPIYSLLFYTDNLELSTYVVQLLLLEGFFATLSPVMTNIVMVCQLRKTALWSQTFIALFRIVATYALMAFIGITGAVVTSIISHIFLTGFYLYRLRKRYNIRIGKIGVGFIYAGIICAIGWATTCFIPINMASKPSILLSMGIIGTVYVAIVGLCVFITRKQVLKLCH